MGNERPPRSEILEATNEGNKTVADSEDSEEDRCSVGIDSETSPLRRRGRRGFERPCIVISGRISLHFWNRGRSLPERRERESHSDKNISNNNNRDRLGKGSKERYLKSTSEAKFEEKKENAKRTMNFV